MLHSQHSTPASRDGGDGGSEPGLFRFTFQAIRLVCLAVALNFPATGAHAASVKIGGTGTGLGTMRLLADAFRQSRSDVQLVVLPSLGSSGAFKAILAGAADIGISARPATPEESSRGATTRAYAKTPFVLATGSKNTVAALTISELSQMYTGRVTRWPDGTLIRLVIRPASDADSVELRKFSPAMDAAVTAALARTGLRMADTDQDNADALEKLPGSLGTTTLAQMISEKRALKVLTLDGTVPSLESLAAGRYAYSKTLYLVTGPRPSQSVKDFVAFIQTPAGRAILEKNGNLVIRE